VRAVQRRQRSRRPLRQRQPEQRCCGRDLRCWPPRVRGPHRRRETAAQGRRGGERGPAAASSHRRLLQGPALAAEQQRFRSCRDEGQRPQRPLPPCRSRVLRQRSLSKGSVRRRQRPPWLRRGLRQWSCRERRGDRGRWSQTNRQTQRRQRCQSTAGRGCRQQRPAAAGGGAALPAHGAPQPCLQARR